MSDGDRQGTRDLTGMLNRASHVLTTRLTEALGEVGLTQRMQCVLIHALEKPRTQAELAELADLDKTTMVATADALEQAGYATRVPAAEDRRARIIDVTARGRKAAVDGQRIVDRVHREALEGLAVREQRAFLDALGRLTDGTLGAASAVNGSVRRRRQPTH